MRRPPRPGCSSLRRDVLSTPLSVPFTITTAGHRLCQERMWNWARVFTPQAWLVYLGGFVFLGILLALIEGPHNAAEYGTSGSKDAWKQDPSKAAVHMIMNGVYIRQTAPPHASLLQAWLAIRHWRSRPLALLPSRGTEPQRPRRRKSF